MKKDWLIFLSLLLIINCTNAANLAPIWLEPPNLLTFSEATPINTLLFTIKTRDPEGDPVTYTDITKGGYFLLDEKNGTCHLVKTIDVDAIPELKNTEYSIGVSDGNNFVTKLIKINFYDANDLAPRFRQTNYQVDIREDANVGDILIKEIVADDIDLSNPFLKHSCLITAEYPTACEVFEFRKLSGSSNKLFKAEMILKKKLNYEDIQNYQYALQLKDGVHTTTQTIEITVIDVSDLPPVFTSKSDSSATIAEEEPSNSPVLTVEARDQDTANRPIYYELCDPNGDGYFQVDSASGRLTIAKKIDRESVTEQTFTVCMKAREVINPVGPILGNDPQTTATTPLTITVTDINDNPPSFANSEYTVSILESIEDQTALPGLQLRITDKDQGTNANFELVIANTDKQVQDTFYIQPNQARGSVIGAIYVKDTRLIDYEQRYKEYTILVKARETSTTERNIGTATVTVKIIDVNDNTPTFGQQTYRHQIKENAPIGEFVTTITANDPDSGLMGNDGLEYSLFENGAELFDIDPVRGRVTVSDYCKTPLVPGENPCIDYETTKSYSLIVMVQDNKGGTGDRKTNYATLIIDILDVNDNSPAFKLENYEYTIVEGTKILSPNTRLQATDADEISKTITYSFVKPNSIFSLNPTTGEISAIVPVDYEDTPNSQGLYVYSARASDGEREALAQVRIRVIDQNDNAPRFQIDNYYASINETAAAGLLTFRIQCRLDEALKYPLIHLNSNCFALSFGTEVVTVLATDVDTGLNGEIRYRISSGAEEKFVIGKSSGIIRVAQNAKFDVDIKNLYTLMVRAEDQGDTPRRTATSFVYITILDANNKNPFFNPATIQVDVNEDSTPATYVTTMKAEDPDQGANITYSFSGTKKQAWDLAGTKVNRANYDYEQAFTVHPLSGVVRVSGPLKRSKAQTIQYDINVFDNSANPVQQGVGSIIFIILAVNTHPPVFTAPWTIGLPQYNITIKENLVDGSVVKAMVATDQDGYVQRYEIIDNPGGFFTIDHDTGVVTSQKPVDYEKQQSTYFVVTASDNGKPSLTATATVYVNVENVNDNQPQFDQSVYMKSIPENSEADTFVLDINASDGDLGTFGDVSYSINDPSGAFKIDKDTGIIRVKDKSLLDREKQPEMTFTVTASDSPNHPFQRKSNTRPVYITLLDVNDNAPEFSTKNYTATVIESIPLQALVKQLDATDADIGINKQIRFNLVSGDPEGLFNVNPTTGKITTKASLIDKVGVHFLTIKAVDKNGASDGLTDISYVKITVVDANNEPPIWIYPDANNYTINVLENQYLGLEVVTVSAVDPDGGAVEYGFMVDGVFLRVNRVDNIEFRINHITGIISAEQVFDREAKNFYTLLLMAKDTGSDQVLSSEVRVLTIKILDTDDHLPEFPLKMNGESKPYYFEVTENAPKGTPVGTVTATDKDIGKHAVVSYLIDGGNTNDRFKIDSNTGKISTNQVLNRENIAQHKLSIKAFNNFSDDSVNTRRKRAIGPNYVDVYITVRDEADSVPVFIYPTGFTKYYSFIPHDSPLSTLVLVMTASDKDLNPELVYSIHSISERFNGTEVTNTAVGDMFTIVTNTMYTDRLVSNKKDMNYYAQLRVTDAEKNEADAISTAWITHPYQEMKLTLDYSPDDAKTYSSSIIDFVHSATDNGLVWIKSIRYHVKDDKVYDDRCDVFLYVADLNAQRLLNGVELDRMLESGMAGVWKDKAELINVVGIAGAGSAVVGANVDWWPVVWALIAFLCVLILALIILFMCCCCGCCANVCATCCEEDRLRRYRYRSTMAEKYRFSQSESATNGSVMVRYLNPAWESKVYSNLGYEHDSGMMSHRSTMQASHMRHASHMSSAQASTQRQTSIQSTTAVARAVSRKDTSNENYTIVSDVLPSRDDPDTARSTVIVAAASNGGVASGQQGRTSTTTTKRTSYMSTRDAAPLPVPQPQVTTISQPAQTLASTEYTVVADLPQLQSSQRAASQYTVVTQPPVQQFETRTVQRTNTIQAAPVAPDQGGYTVLTDLNLPRSVSLPQQTQTQTQTYVQTTVPVQQSQVVQQTGGATSFKVVTDLPFSEVQRM